jgi:hypothetical protein
MNTAYTLKPWSDVVQPHADVRSGELSMGTYAANLAAVASGEHRGAAVYANADQFFASTYFTEAMTSILRDVWEALSGKGGDRALQLRTPFGGGKTHSLLALYHLATSPEAARGVPELKELPELGPVRVAVLSGEWLDPQRGREVEGRRIRTLWGELAYQLGGWEKFDELFEGGDEGTPLTGVNLTPLLDGGPTLILVDEALIYVAKGKSIPRGESNVGREALIFLQHLSEAVNQSRQAAMVYSLQASITEAVEDEASLRALEQIAGRIDQRREPVTGDEVLRVVQRRLFESLGDDSVRAEVADLYAAQYRVELEAVAETKSERREASVAAKHLRERILLAYPFHPELIDLMNHRWGSLPTYQRTRGALQFLATVVHNLWTSDGRGKAGALIGPGDVDLRDERTRTAFFAQVGEEKQYRSVAEADFINPDAGARRVDERLGRDSPALARLEIGTRVATAIMLMSFGAREGEERGALEREILEATLVSELDGNLVRSALKELRGEALLYLHYTGRRYRFEPRANLNKLVASEQDKLDSEEVLDELRAALERKLAGGGMGREIVIWPDSPDKVKDEVRCFRVVYLHPEWSEAKIPASAFIGAGNRKYKNGLAIALPREASFDRARRATRQLMAIDRLIGDKSRHGFDDQQIEELKERRAQAQSDLDGALRETYGQVLLPKGLNGQSVDFEVVDLSTTLAVGHQLHDRVRAALENYVFDTLQPSKLKAVAKLSERDAVPCEELVAGVYTHFEMPRLWSPQAIEAAVATGVSDGLFGYCVDVEFDGGSPRINDPSLVRFRDMSSSEEFDLGPGAALLSPEFAASFIESEEPEPSAEEPPGSKDSKSVAVDGDKGAPTKVRVTINATEDDLHTINTALAGLRRITTPGKMRIMVEAEAQSSEGAIDPISFQNNVRQHLEDDEDVQFSEDWGTSAPE